MASSAAFLDLCQSSDDSDNDDILRQRFLFKTSSVKKSSKGAGAGAGHHSMPPSSATVATSSTKRRPMSKIPAVTASKIPPAKKKKGPVKKSEQPHCLIWVCTHGKGQSRSWRQKDLKLVGVYPTKAAAQAAKENVMAQHTCCGHGDILVGGHWDDEIDLVIREAPMFFDP